MSTTISFDSATSTVAELDVQTTHTVNVTRDETDGTASVDYTTSAGTALVGSDFSTSSGTLTYADGEATKTISILIDGDSVPENSETFTITLSNASASVGSILIGTGTHTVTITDADTNDVGFSQETSTVAESSTTHTVTVNRTHDVGTLTVNYATVDITATAGEDYTAANSSLTFSPGETSKNISITISGDSKNENDETFRIDLSSASTTEGNALITGHTTHTVTISNNDNTEIAISGSSSSITESGGSIDLTITRSDTNGTASVQYATSDGTATGGDDYIAHPLTTINFADGESSKTITIFITNEASPEADETFNVELQNQTSQFGTATIGGTNPHVVTITNDDNTEISFSAAAQSVSESAGTANVTVTRTQTTGTATVDYASGGGTATSNVDYSAVSGTLSFADGEASATIPVAITNDSINEASETFEITLSNATSQYGGVSITGANPHVVTITNDDNTEVAFSSATSSVNENAGAATITVTRDKTNGVASVNYSTSDGTATAADSDYTQAISETLTFADGEASKDISILIPNDSKNENDETFSVTLNSVNCEFGTGTVGMHSTHTVTITNEDVSNLSFAVQGGTSVSENAGTVDIVVNRSDTNGTAEVTYSTSNDTADQGSDYTEISNATLSFADGQASATISVSILNDSVNEDSETFKVTLIKATSQYGAINVTGTNPHVVTITNDDSSTLGFDSASSKAIEGSSGTSTHSITISRTDTNGTASVNYATGGGTANAGSDYTATSGTLSFAHGEKTASIDVTIIGDSSTESPDETFDVTLSNLSGTGNVSLGTSVHSVTILDSNTATLSFASGTGQISESSSPYTINVVRASTSGTASVDYTVSDGSAVDGNDYTASTSALTFADGEGTKTISVPILNDATSEADETFEITLSNASGATIAGTNPHVVTITDDEDTEFSFSTATQSVSENVGTATITVTRTRSNGTATVDYASGGGTATSNVDYSAVSGTLSFADGEASATIPVTITNDSINEASETFEVTLSNAASQLGTSSIVGANPHVVTITNDDNTEVSFSSAASSVNENAGTATITVTRDKTNGTASVNYSTSDGTATVADSDYTQVISGTLDFADGEASKDISIAISNDSKNENNETFSVTLNSVTCEFGTGTIVAHSTHTVTITNEDVSSLSFAVQGGTSVSENAGTVDIVVNRSDTNGTAEVTYSTSNDTADHGLDYSKAYGATLSFADGEASATISVPILNDSINEDSETFKVTLIKATSQYGVINVTGTNPHVVTITNDDSSTLGFDSASSRAIEGSSGASTHRITISRTDTNGTAKVDYATGGGTANAGSDYVANSGTLSFAHGEKAASIDVTIIGDSSTESPDETFDVTLSNLSGTGNVSLGTSVHSVTILDSNTATVSFASGTGQISESSSPYTINVVRGSTSGTVEVDYAVSDGSAVDGSDYSSLSSKLTFADGEGTKTISVPILNDSISETGETFRITLSNVSGATIAGTNPHVVTITDDENTEFSFSTVAQLVSENAGNATITVTRTQSNGTATVDYATSDVTATGDIDYSRQASGTVSFADGASSETISIPIITDKINELSETFTVTLSNPSSQYGTSSLGANNSHVVTITDDDTTVISFEGTTSSVTEANTTLNIRVSRSKANGTATVNYSTGNLTALGGEDYTAVAVGLLSFADGESFKDIAITISGDSKNEDDETFTVTLDSASAEFGSISINPSYRVHTVTITNDDVSNFSFASGTSSIVEDTTTINITVNRSDSNGTATAYYTTSDVTTLATVDYTPKTGTVTFADGVSTGTISIDILGDSENEDDETFNVTLTDAVSQYGASAIIGTNPHVVTITNDDASTLGFVIASSNAAEPSSGTSTHTIGVHRTDSNGAASVDYATGGGTATAGVDYTASSGTLNFADKQSFAEINITIAYDGSTETPNETFNVTLSNITSVGTTSFGDNVHVVTILSHDTNQIYFQTPSSTVTEDNTTHTVNVVRSDDTSSATVDFATGGGTAVADSDYTATNGQLSFGVGESSKTISVPILEDSINEDSETFEITLSNPSVGSTIVSTNPHVVTISDDDVTNISFASPSQSVSENAGSVTVNLNRSNTNGYAIVNWTTSSSTALDGSDFTGTSSGKAIFSNGQSSATIAIAVPIIDDSINEDSENFHITLSNPESQFGTASITGTNPATITITDDDACEVSFENATSSVSEGGTSHTINVKRNNTGGNLTVDYATSNGTAIAGSDYTSTSGTLSIGPGNDSASITVNITQDSINENNETFVVTLSNVSIDIGSATITGATHVVTINEDSDTSNIFFNTATSSITEAATTVSVEVKRSDTNGTATVDYATSDVTATAGSDYVGIATTTLNFADGVDTATISVSVSHDTTNENNETFEIQLSNPTSQFGTASITGSNPHVVTIANNDVSNISFDTNSQTVAESVGSVSITVNRSDTNGTATVNYSTNSDTATSTSGDYTNTSGTLSFDDGQATKTITVPIIDDLINEDSETFSVSLSSPTSQYGAVAITGTNLHTVTITDNDASTISFDSATSTRTEAGGTFNHTVTVSRTLTNGTASVAFATSDGTAVASSDYTETIGTLNFGDGEASKTITIPILGDSINEADKTFNVTLSSATSEFGSISISGTNPHVVTIIDDDTTTISFTSGTSSVTEANTAHTVNVTRSNTTGTASVQYTTSDDTAAAGSDYTAVGPGTINFADGVSSATISVDILEDTAYEGPQTFNIILSNPVAQFGGVAISGETHVVTILDDDSLVIAFDSATSSVTEGTSPHTVAVSRTSSAGTASVDFATSAGTALVGSDFSTSSGTLSFADGETTKNVSIIIDNDVVNEDSENFTIALSNPAAEHGSVSLGTSSHTVTIVDNDTTEISFSADNSSVAEGSTTHSITATRSKTNGTASVNYATSNGTATAGSDYTGVVTDTLNFADGESTATINITILGDSVNENDETFVVTLSSPSTQYGSSALGTSTHTVTITNNDASEISFASSTSSVSESAGTASITVNRTDTNGTATVNYSTSDDTATAGSDYTAVTNELLSFADGEGSKTITVNITSDTTNENDETFKVHLANPTSQFGSISLGSTHTHTVTITNNDSSVISFSSLTSSVSESSSPHLIQIQRTDSNGSATVDYATTGVTATGNVDYNELSGTITFPDGQSSVDISLSITSDTLNEDSETLQLTLSNATSAVGSISIHADDTHTVTITDDDVTEIYSSPYSSAINETQAGTFVHTITIYRNRTNGTASVDYATSDVTATAGSDYVAIPLTTLNFADGESTATISIQINGDTTNESDETFNLTLSNATAQYGSVTLTNAAGASVSSFVHLVTITDDDPTEISFNTASSTVVESAGSVSIRIDRSKTRGTATVNYATSDISAVDGDDYTGISGQLQFNDGDAFGTLVINITADGVAEGNETFSLNLTSPTTQFGTIDIAGASSHIVTILGEEITGAPQTMSNALHLHGRTLGFSYNKKYLGEMLGNYGSVKTINFQGYTSQMTGDGANSDIKGVSESFTDINSIIASASDDLTSTFVINGINIGRGRITSLDFSDNVNPIQSTSYGITLEIYDDLVENVESAFAAEFASQDNIYPTNNFGIQSYDSQYIEDISEDFSFQKDEGGSFSYEHSFNVKYVSGHHADLVSHAQNLANIILNPAASTRPNFPFNDDFAAAVSADGITDFRNAYNDSIVEAGQHRFDETYDLVNADFRFVRKFKTFGSKSTDVSNQHSRSLTLGEDGHASVTENGTVDAFEANDTENFNNEVDTIVAASYTRCNDFWKASQGNLARTDNANSNNKGGTISITSDLYTQYVSYGRNVDPHNGSLTYTITYTNNPRYTANGIKEFSLSINENFENSSLSISENGTIRPYGNVAIDYDKGFDNSTNAASALTAADSRITAEFSSYLNLALDDSVRGWRTYSHKDEVLKRTSYNISYPKFGKVITYSAEYSCDGSFLSPADTAALGLHSINVEHSDNTPNVMKQGYLIPHNGEIIQTRKQTTIGTRDISVTAQRVRDANYLTNPPDLSSTSPAISHLKDIAFVMVKRIPLSYRDYLVNDIYISDYNYSFDSETGQISLNLQASFTMASVDTNGGNNTIKPKRYRV